MITALAILGLHGGVVLLFSLGWRRFLCVVIVLVVSFFSFLSGALRQTSRGEGTSSFPCDWGSRGGRLERQLLQSLGRPDSPQPYLVTIQHLEGSAYVACRK